ncbi:MAG: helicase-related protein [Polyangiaceae bacterium]
MQDAYTKLAAGHVSVDLIDDDAPIPVPADGEVDEAIARKVRRTAYWYGRLREARARVGRAHKLQEHLAETEHPRLLAAVEEIEKWTGAVSGPEKVLVFGVFLQPLKLLRDVLDARHLLRAADAGRPVPRTLSAHKSLLRRQLERMQGDLSGKLRGATDPSNAIRESHAEYERLRERVRDHARRSAADWLRDPALFGAPTVDPAFEKHLRDAFVTFVVEQLLTSSDMAVDNPRVDTFGKEFISKRLRPLLGDGAQDDREHEGSAPIETVGRVLADDGNQVSSFARLLHGGTDWNTRRFLQSAFNREGAPPWVLIAQSQVGREGLNLHEQCRVVLQFHAEWNPAVLEQQIGRVDRKGSLWERKARAWLDGGAVGDPPYIEVRQLVLDGTYDAYQWQRVGRRQQAFDASLFGTLLPAEAWARVPEERKAELIAAAPNFSPVRTRRSDS